MKTAMQELIEYLEAGKKYITGFPGEFYAGQEVVVSTTIETAIELLAKEKDQIEAAYQNGYNNGNVDSGKIPARYFRETYTTQST